MGCSSRNIAKSLCMERRRDHDQANGSFNGPHTRPETPKHIFELDLSLESDRILAVRLEGQRRRQYADHDRPRPFQVSTVPGDSLGQPPRHATSAFRDTKPDLPMGLTTPNSLAFYADQFAGEGHKSSSLANGSRSDGMLREPAASVPGRMAGDLSWMCSDSSGRSEEIGSQYIVDVARVAGSRRVCRVDSRRPPKAFAVYGAAGGQGTGQRSARVIVAPLLFCYRFSPRTRLLS